MQTTRISPIFLHMDQLMPIKTDMFVSLGSFAHAHFLLFFLQTNDLPRGLVPQVPSETHVI